MVIYLITIIKEVTHLIYHFPKRPLSLFKNPPSALIIQPTL